MDVSKEFSRRKLFIDLIRITAGIGLFIASWFLVFDQSAFTLYQFISSRSLLFSFLIGGSLLVLGVFSRTVAITIILLLLNAWFANIISPILAVVMITPLLFPLVNGNGELSLGSYLTTVKEEE